MLGLERVSKRFGDVAALVEVTVTFARGKTTVLLGESGSGKSTALRCLNGLVTPDAGQVSFDGAALLDQDLNTVRQRMGYLIQGGGLFPHLTAGDNVRLLGRHLGRTDASMEPRLRALLALTRLERDVLDRYPDQLSGGQQQRVALMRALMLEPEVLLLDEPFGALDPLVRLELQKDLKRIVEDLDTTVAMVTHDLPEAALFADHVVLFSKGRVLQQGAMHTLLEAPADERARRFVEAHRAMLQHLELAR